jgi:hypothetical protein
MVRTTSLIAGTRSTLGLKIKDKRYKENVKKKSCGGEEEDIGGGGELAVTY